VPLITDNRFDNPDAAYRLIVEGQRGLDAGNAAAFNARLVLLLANHIGDRAVLAEAVTLARETQPAAPRAR
jgi:Protein of unknown function (DUF2783)